MKLIIWLTVLGIMVATGVVRAQPNVRPRAEFIPFGRLELVQRIEERILTSPAFAEITKLLGDSSARLSKEQKDRLQTILPRSYEIDALLFQNRYPTETANPNLTQAAVETNVRELKNLREEIFGILEGAVRASGVTIEAVSDTASLYARFEPSPPVQPRVEASARRQIWIVPSQESGLRERKISLSVTADAKFAIWLPTSSTQIDPHYIAGELVRAEKPKLWPTAGYPYGYRPSARYEGISIAIVASPLDSTKAEVWSKAEFMSYPMNGLKASAAIVLYDLKNKDIGAALLEDLELDPNSPPPVSYDREPVFIELSK